MPIEIYRLMEDLANGRLEVLGCLALGLCHVISQAVS